MKIEEMIKKSLVTIVTSRIQETGVEVTGWKEDFNTEEFYSHCSCAYSETSYEVLIEYTSDQSKGRIRTMSYEGRFSDLIKELDSHSE